MERKTISFCPLCAPTFQFTVANDYHPSDILNLYLLLIFHQSFTNAFPLLIGSCEDYALYSVL